MPRKLTEHVFTLHTETVDIPLVVTPQALADFREHGLDAMNECLYHMGTRASGADRAAPRPEDMVAGMFLDGLATDNTRKLFLCALWMAHNRPDVTGLVSDGDSAQFVRRAHQPPGLTRQASATAH